MVLTYPGPSAWIAETAFRIQPRSWLPDGPRTLSWGDFPEVESRPEGEDENAQIHCEIRQPDRVSIMRQRGQVRISGLTVDISVMSSDSWVVRTQKTPELLSHEQGHFDLTGLMGRGNG